MTDDEYREEAPRTGLRIGGLVLALLIFALLVGGWFIVKDLNHPVAGRPTVEPMLGGAGSVGESTARTAPSVPATTAQLPPARLPATPTPPPGVPGDDYTVAGVGNERTIECADHDVSISGVRNTVTLVGHCGRVDVSGVENTVTIDAAELIDVSGINNDVTFHSGEPQLSKSGIDNTLQRG